MRGDVRLVALAAVALIAAGGAAGAWDQFQGDAARRAEAVAPTGAWDVREVFRLFDAPATGGGLTSPAFVAWSGGVAGVVRTGDGGCALVTWTPGAAPRQQLLPDCQEPRFQGILAGRALVCTWGPADQAGLQAHDLQTGERAWRVSVEELGAIAIAADITWGCNGSAVDGAGGRVLAAFGASRDNVHARQHLVASIGSDGSVHWTSMATDDQSGEPLGLLLLPRSVTRSESGVAVVGTANCGGLEGCTALATTPVSAVAYFDLSGQYLGVAWSARGDGERYAVAAGARTAVRLGNEVVIADPLAPGSATRLRIDGFQQPLVGAWQEAGPLALEGRVLFPLREQLVAVTMTPPARDWTWVGLADHTVHGGFAAGGGALAVAAWNSDDARLVRLDGATGRVTQVLDLPLPGGSLVAPEWRDGAADQVGLSWIPLGTAGVLAVSPDGTAARIGAASATTATAAPDTFFPQVTQAVTVRLDAPGATIAWGDGAVTLAGSQTEATHAFASAGRQETRVTFPQADGTTQTRVLPFVVGGGPTPGGSGRFPSWTVDPSYPAPGTPATVTLSATEPIVEAFVAWGDTAQEHVTPQAATVTLTHTYSAPGRYPLAITVVYADGHAAADEREVQIGGPYKDGFWQRAFAPENQDTTWGIIGIALAVVGGSIGLAVRWRRRSHFMHARQRVETIRRLSRHEPLAALAELRDARADMRSAHDRGRLDDAQYQIVRDACQDLLNRIMVLVVDPMRGVLSDSFQQRLAAAQHDGAIDVDESADLHAALATEQLTDAQRATLRRLLDAWAG